MTNQHSTPNAINTRNKPRVLLIGLEVPENSDDFDESMDELAALVQTAGGDVVGRVTQKRQGIDPAYYLGKGKSEEVRELVSARKADMIVANNDLSPSQGRNLEKIVNVGVMDRTEIILTIFAENARTHQAKVQVNLAQAEYELPRLKRRWTHLHRERGGGAFRGGAGERQIELDRRIVRKAITDNKRELQLIRERKERMIHARAELFSVALVGYTNAGKSTLMNTLTDAGVLAENKLFSTLDTRTRVWDLGGHHRSLISDTVGFIRHLPHHLVEAFQATLEEAVTADLLLHVVDASAYKPERQVAAVNEVLTALGCDTHRTLVVLNKLDRLQDRGGDLNVLRSMFPGALEISAVTGDGVDSLTRAVRDILREQEIEIDVQASLANGRLIAFLKTNTEILNEHYDENGSADFVVRIDPKLMKKLAEMQRGDNQASFSERRRAVVIPPDPEDRESAPDFPSATLEPAAVRFDFDFPLRRPADADTDSSDADVDVDSDADADVFVAAADENGALAADDRAAELLTEADAATDTDDSRSH